MCRSRTHWITVTTLAALTRNTRNLVVLEFAQRPDQDGRARITADRCLLASIKGFPPFANYRVVSAVSPVAFGTTAGRARPGEGITGVIDLLRPNEMKMEISPPRRNPPCICYHFSTFLPRPVFARAGVYSSPAIRNCPQFISPTGGSPPCTTKRGTTRGENGSLFAGNDTGRSGSADLHPADLRPFYAHSASRRMQILVISSPRNGSARVSWLVLLNLNIPIGISRGEKMYEYEEQKWRHSAVILSPLFRGKFRARDCLRNFAAYH